MVAACTRNEYGDLTLSQKAAERRVLAARMTVSSRTLPFLIGLGSVTRARPTLLPVSADRPQADRMGL